MQKHSIARAVAGARWNPRDGLIGSDQGIWLDPSDLSTMYTESGASPATLTPATLNGLVGRILDKSGRGNHAYSSTDAKRPTLRIDANGCYYLQFNGTSSSLQTASIDFTATDKMFVSAGIRKLSDATSGVIVELSTGGSVGSFLINTPSTAGNSDYQAVLYGNGNGIQRATSFAAPITNVVSASYNFAGAAVTDEISIRVNSATPTLASIGTPSTTAAFGNYPLYIGARAGTSLFFNGNLYQLVICGRPTSVPIDQITRTEEFVNRKTKAY